jgi:DNA topoisomerase-2
VYTRLSANFEKYIRDIDLAPAHDDPEHEPPAFYVPVIPLVLANGTKGIATGFATNILPRSQKALQKAVIEYITTGDIKKRIPISFPDFKGKVVWDAGNDRYSILGVYEKKSKTVMEITEVPYGFDRESYVKILDKLEDDGDIVGYEDLCDKAGFSFEVKLKLATSAKWNDEKIIRKFKLSKPASENITVIDQDGKLREYEDERELVKDFCEYRIGILHKRIELRQAEATELARWLNIKMQFIQAVLDDKIKFKNRKKKDVGAQILANTEALESDVDKLLRINIMSLTDEMVKELQKEIKSAKAERTFWSKETPNNQFMVDLEEI